MGNITITLTPREVTAILRAIEDSSYCHEDWIKEAKDPEAVATIPEWREHVATIAVVEARLLDEQAERRAKEVSFTVTFNDCPKGATP